MGRLLSSYGEGYTARLPGRQALGVAGHPWRDRDAYRHLTAFPGWPFPNSLFDPGHGVANYAEHIAEEYAMLDCLSRGRLIAGLVRGVPNEYFAYNVRAAESRARFEEAHDILVRAWTDEWMNFDGKFYQYKNYTLWPKPVQKPHPPIWVPANSAETIEWLAQRRYVVAQTFAGTGLVKAAFEYHRKIAAKLGWTPPASTYAIMRHVYVSTTDARAREECQAAITYFTRLLERSPNVLALYGDTGAGYVSPGSFDYKGMKVALAAPRP